jgi:WD repeat-containing protein 76
MSFHPTEEKALVFAGDKEGALGMFDASQELPDLDDDEDAPRPTPVISALPIHARTITAIHFNGEDMNSVFTSSYDSSVRKTDLVKDISQQVLAPSEMDGDLPISAIDIPPNDSSLIWFSTLEGMVGKHDIREKSQQYETWQLADHKIGGFTLHPKVPHLLATASLDRYMRVWDVRMLGKNGKINRALVGENLARLSVSHASWSSAGHVATSSYDDKIRIHSFPDAGEWKQGHELSDKEMEPTAMISHNNQTGRWVTILKPQWQRKPRDGIQKFVIGNMNRFVDVFDASGVQLAQLDGDGITAVPAVAHFHPTMDWVAGGNASGKLCLWQ